MLKLEMNNFIKYTIIMISMLYYFIFNKIMDNFSDCYTSFIYLCEMIVKYDNIIKNKIKINRFMKTKEEEPKNNLINIINFINKVINNDISKRNSKNDNNEMIDAYNEYLKLKANIFKFMGEYFIESIFLNLVNGRVSNDISFLEFKNLVKIF